jgi:hypothetical protein
MKTLRKILLTGLTLVSLATIAYAGGTVYNNSPIKSSGTAENGSSYWVNSNTRSLKGFPNLKAPSSEYGIWIKCDSNENLMPLQEEAVKDLMQQYPTIFFGMEQVLINGGPITNPDVNLVQVMDSIDHISYRRAAEENMIDLWYRGLMATAETRKSYDTVDGVTNRATHQQVVGFAEDLASKICGK